jgi:hypothetical protein
LDAESIELAGTYIDRGILSSNYRDDARHIAMATVADVDILVSWNFRHIVHFDKIRQFNAVNLEKSKHSNRGVRRGTQRAENALAFLRVIYGSIKMKTNKEKSWN